MYLWWVSVLAGAALAALVVAFRSGRVPRRRLARQAGGVPPLLPALQKQPDPAKIVFNVRLLIHHRTRPFAARALSKGLRFQSTVAAGVPAWVRADPSRIALVLTSLLDNALKSTSEGAVCVEVALSLDAGCPRLRFNIHDTGAGIDADTLALLLGSDAPVDSTSPHGLAISRRVVALMAGTLGAESEPRGGSTFWFSIPVEVVKCGHAGSWKRLHTLRTPASLATVRPLLPRASMPGKRVLIVEEDPAKQVVTLWGVRALGYAALVSGAQEAAAICQRTPFELILLDSAIADRNETIAEIRRLETGCIPIIAMSLTDDGRADVDGHLSKPVCMIELARTLDHWLGAAGPASASEASADRLRVPV